MQSNGNGKFKNVSRLIGRMKTLQVKAQRKEDEDDRPRYGRPPQGPKTKIMFHPRITRPKYAYTILKCSSSCS
jgi:type IV secretory pathway ATPase VirB11/archaellum biosynthesis ATPase